MSAAKQLSIRLAAVGGDKVRQELKSLGSDGQQAFSRITQVISPANDNLRKLNDTAKVFGSTLKQVSALAGAFLGFKGITGTFSALFGANKSFEQLSGSLKTVTGSAKGAKEAFALIEDFAVSTPYQLNEIVEAFIRLKALGLEPSKEALTSYGNTASAFGKNILDYVGAVASATVGEFERLKTFGIKAKVVNEDVSFTFAGVTTKIKKNASEIEKYLRSLGDVNFAGAMDEQMKTMNGILSNIEDNFEKIYRKIGKSGLNDALREAFSEFNDLTGKGDKLAETIGETLATAVKVASKAFFLLADNADILLTILTTKFSASVLTYGWKALVSSLSSVNIATKGTISGFVMMSQVSKIAAVQMAVTTGAAKLLSTALAFIGGPMGLAILAGTALYKLADSHDIAKKASQDHAETLQGLKDALKDTTEEINVLNETAKNEAIASWSKKLKDSEQNIKDLEKSLKNTGGVSLFQRLKPDLFKEDWEIMADDLRRILSESKIDLEQYQKEIWELAKDYPDFTPMAKSIQENILLLKAARIDAQKARDELNNINNPPKVDGDIKNIPIKGQTDEEIAKIQKLIANLQEQNVAILRVNEARKNGEDALQKALAHNEYENQIKQIGITLTKEQSSEIKSLVNRKFELEAIDKKYQENLKKQDEAEKKHQENLKDIQKRLLDLKSPYEKAIDEANAWKEEALLGLDETKSGYIAFKSDVEAIYQDMVEKAKKSAVESSTAWQDGITRGLQGVYSDVSNLGRNTENLIKNSFKKMEDTIVDFVMTGKLNMADFANSVISDMMRMAIQYSVIQPLMGGMMGYFGIPMPTAHSGGIVGNDVLSTKSVNPNVFTNANKYHSGGLVGDEVPIIAKRGEGVFTKGQMEALGQKQGRSVEVKVNVINNVSGVKADVQSSKDTNGNVLLNIFVEQIEANISRNVSRGEGLAQVLEQRYALNPAMGSYR